MQNQYDLYESSVKSLRFTSQIVSEITLAEPQPKSKMRKKYIDKKRRASP
jgi:hypothetical protein